MPRPRSLPDDVLLEMVPEAWASTGEIHTHVGLQGHRIGNYQMGASLRRLVLRGLVEHNGFPGTRKLAWRRVMSNNRAKEEARLRALGTIDALLTIHQRVDVSGCLCGWGELGKSFATHQAEVLTTGALLDELKERGYREMGPDGRALSDAARQLRATLPLAMIEGGRPERDGEAAAS